MPRFLAAAALLASLLCVATGQAQQVASGISKTSLPSGTSASSFTGVDPRNITFTPVNTSGALRNFNTTTMVRPTNAPSPLSIANIFRSFSLPSWPPKLASTSVVPQSQNQFQPTLPKGQYTFPPAAPQK